MKTFALIGAAGYIAPRHLKAIRETQNKLCCALDNNDSVGIMDSYFPEARFFTEFERFDRHIDKMRRSGNSVDYISICTPNYLHDSQIRFALRSRAHAICEKPLVLNPWNVEALKEYEQEFGHYIYNILQLRLHPSIIALKKRIEEGPEDRIYEVDLNYITSRGSWYFASWKADLAKSGGIATNIGVHFFDMLTWVFGEAAENIVHVHTHNKAAGFLQLKKARVRWFLSVDIDDVPLLLREQGQRTYRSITLEGEEIEFSGGFTDLHTKSYEEILAGRGFRVAEALRSIEIVHNIRSRKPLGLQGDYHPYLREIDVLPQADWSNGYLLHSDG
jgi:UDP-N-acetyl-2-amino-2-deoxyglucuronate dehydrogenase